MLLGWFGKGVGVVGVNCIRGWGLFGWFGESGWDCWGDLYGGGGGLENRCFLCIEIMTLYNLRMYKIFHPFR